MRWHPHRHRRRSLHGASFLIRHEFEPMQHRKYKRRGAATYVNAARDRVDPAEAEQRLAERDRPEVADTRTEAQRWLNDPPADRWALAAKR